MKERFLERWPLVKPLLVPVVLYVGLSILAILLLDSTLDAFWRAALLVAPMLPGIFLALGIVRAIAQLDEMNRKIIQESAVVTFGITLFLLIPLGLLEIGGLLRFNSIYIAGFMALTWLIAKLIITRRYQ